MKLIIFALISLVITINHNFAATKEELVQEVQNKLILNYFQDNDSLKESATKIKKIMTEKMKKNYSVIELNELKVISEDKVFNAVNNKFQNQDIKVEDILIKNSETELKKIDSKKKNVIISIKKTLNLDKYSQQATNILEKKLDEQLPEGLPEMAMKGIKSSLKEKAQDGLIATIYERLGTLELKDLNSYHQLTKKKSFLKYYSDLMVASYNELK